MQDGRTGVPPLDFVRCVPMDERVNYKSLEDAVKSMWQGQTLLFGTSGCKVVRDLLARLRSRIDMAW